MGSGPLLGSCLALHEQPEKEVSFRACNVMKFLQIRFIEINRVGFL